MYSYKQLREAHKTCTEKATTHEEYRQGSQVFLGELNKALGVCATETGKPDVFRRPDGVPYKAPNSCSASEVPIKRLAEAIMGRDLVEEYFNPANDFDFRRLHEAAIDPTSFIDINTFSVATSGLVNAQIMERYSNPQYIGRNLINIVPTQMNGHKRIGVGRLTPVSKAAKGRQPGERHVEVGLTQQTQLTPPTEEQALKCVSGDTLVDTLYGPEKIQDLAEQGGTVQVWTRDPDTGFTVVAEAAHVAIYGRNEQLLRVHLDNGTHIDCTPDHKFFVDGEKVEAQDLTPEMDLVGLQEVDADLGEGGTAVAVGVQVCVRHAVKIEVLPGRHDVYCLEVQGYGVFFANGVLISNCVITKEVVYFDLTSQVLETAGEVGDELARQQEESIANEILGVTNSYNLNGVSLNTYQTTSPWINDGVNIFAAYQNLDVARQLFIGMTDPITGREIQINGLTILGMPQNEVLFRNQLFGANVMLGTQLNSNFPSQWITSQNPIGNMGKLPGSTMGGGTYQFVPLTSFWYHRATAADGLNLSASDASKLWFVGDFARAVEWYENWPATPWSASADELDMKDRGLIQVNGCSYRGVVFTKEPRFEVRNKAA